MFFVCFVFVNSIFFFFEGLHCIEVLSRLFEFYLSFPDNVHIISTDEFVTDPQEK